MNSTNRVQKIEELLEENHLPIYRQKQIFSAVYQKHLKSYAEMTALPKDLRELLASELEPKVLSLKNVLETKDEQADKVLFETRDSKKRNGWFYYIFNSRSRVKYVIQQNPFGPFGLPKRRLQWLTTMLPEEL